MPSQVVDNVVLQTSNTGTSVLPEIIGKGKNATLKKDTPCPALTENLMLGPAKYNCATQSETQTEARKSNPNHIMLGWHDEIPRWKRGSNITWAASCHNYPRIDQACYAANQLKAAAAEWNALEVGVSFEWVDSKDDATFLLQYDNEEGDTLAEGFFPNENINNDVKVYHAAFEPRNIGIMKEIFLHELGHVLGLRHEFAAIEGNFVPFGSKNEFSVMSYSFPPKLQDTDKKDTKAFYAYTEPMIGGYRIVEKIPAA